MKSAVPYRLVIESEENHGMVFPLRDRSVTIGRGPQNTIQLIDTRMSRMHARIDQGPDAWVVHDLQSKNGVLVNSVPITAPIRLHPSDRVQVGNTVFIFEADVQSEAGHDPTVDTGVRLVDDVDSGLEARHVLHMPADDPDKEISAVHAVPEEMDERLRSIYQVGQIIQSMLDLDEILNKVMEIVCRVMRPSQACIMLLDRKRDALVPKVVRKIDQEADDIVISGSVLHQAMKDRVAVVMSDGDRDLRFREAESIVAQRIKSAICVPLVSKDEVFGVLYIDVRGGLRRYSDSDLQWAAGVAGQAALAIAISLLHAEMLEKHRNEQEMEIARSIQMNLLPRAMPQIRGFEFAGLSIPARQVGGDYFDILKLLDGSLALVIADVSGKGVPSALLLASFRAMMRIEVQKLNAENLAEIVERLNDMIHQDATSGMFITMTLCHFDPELRRLTYCNAGHYYPILHRPDGTLAKLETGGSLLGVMAGMAYGQEAIDIPPGSTLAFVTDGVIDALDPQDEAFGSERLENFIRRNAHLSARDFCEELEKTVRQFQGTADQFDDLTVMALRALRNN